MKRLSLAFALLIPLLSMSCRSLPPIRTETSVDLDRFMGDWHVAANIPTLLERDAWNALESYEKRADGVILTTFSYNKGGPEGPLKTYHPKGFVRDTGSNAVWGMRFIWPFKAEYIIVYVDDDYQATLIGRRKRDYLWIMTRSAHPDEATVETLIDLAVEQGYPRERIQRVPHSPAQ